jgi:hypothetical protein
MATKYLPLPFPECPGCGLSWNTCQHSDCGGDIEVEPTSREVACADCWCRWEIYDSIFHCRCGYSFQANDVSEAIESLLSVCRQLATMLDANERAMTSMRARSEMSARSFAAMLVKNLGKAAGFVIGKLLGKFI